MLIPSRASSRNSAAVSETPGANGHGARERIWIAFAVVVALLPLAGVFTLGRVFYVRDLSIGFWDRHLWLRHNIWSGEWPLWDPYLAAGQSAVADGLHQMLLLPVLALRLLGPEVVSFNLWVALPFPLMALGTYLFLRLRSSPPAATLGSITYSMSGPVMSTGNFPNMSWSVAALPWVLWAASRCRGLRDGGRISVIALIFAGQAVAGEPVTMAATAALALALTLVVGHPDTQRCWHKRGSTALAVAGGLALGSLMAAAQLLPTWEAVSASWRPLIRARDFWSLHPFALVETVIPHFFGNFFDAFKLEDMPWLGPLNSGREPFFYSVYVGPAVLALACFGAISPGQRAWARFWSATAVLAVFAAMGGNTPVYPVVRDYLPVIGSFRFPVKYLVVSAIALAALAAAAWDELASSGRQLTPVTSRHRAAWLTGVAVPLVMSLAAGLLYVGASYFPALAAQGWQRLAAWMGIVDAGRAADFMVRSIGETTWKAALLSSVVTVFMALALSRRSEAGLARHALLGIVAADLMRAAAGLNPTCDVRLLETARWVEIARGNPDSRFYLGGKMGGTIVSTDPDAPTTVMVPPEVPTMVRRAIVARQTLLFPGGVQAREMLSFDLPVLWPRVFESTHVRFVKGTADERARFLSRTAVRFRMLPSNRAAGRPEAPAGVFAGVSIVDFGPTLTRAFVVPEAVVVPAQDEQMNAMFGPDFDDRRTAMLGMQPGPPDGTASPPTEPRARIVTESANRVTVEAGAGQAGGFLVLLDSYSPDWLVTVDGKPGTVYRANLLFRAVRLAPGMHTVEFRYRPKMFVLGAVLSLAALLTTAVVAFRVRVDQQPPIAAGT